MLSYVSSFPLMEVYAVLVTLVLHYVYILQIMYKGRKLDAWKTTWFRKQQINSGHTSPIRAPNTMVIIKKNL